MTRSATVTVSSDIVSVITDTEDNNTQRYNYSLGYSLVYSYGSGDLSTSVGVNQVNQFSKNTGILTAGAEQQIDLSAVNTTLYGNSLTVNFDEVKGIVVENINSGTGQIINILATGTNAFTNMFNGESGNMKINPYGTYHYSDIYGTPVTSNNRLLYLRNNGSDSVGYSIVIVGINTGLLTDSIPTP